MAATAAGTEERGRPRPRHHPGRPGAFPRPLRAPRTRRPRPARGRHRRAADPGPPTPDTPTAVPFTYPPSGDATYPGPGPSGGGRSTPGKLKAWLPVAIVAALIGGGIGAGVTALANNNSGGSGDNVTIHESAAAPGAAVLSGNVTIPQLVNKVIHSVVSIDVKSGGNEDEGTGMIITSDGEVLTNNHVIELYSEGGNTGTITVTEYGQTKALPTTLVGYDQTKDVALLKINGASNLPTVTFGNSGKAVVGDAVVAIGNALGLAAGTPTVTQGIVSALGRSVTAGGEGTADRDPPEHDPDRRRHQPRQLGRTAHRHVGPGHRHEHGRRRHVERRHVVAEHRLRHSGRLGRGAHLRARRRAASPATAAATSASTSRP